MYWYIAKIFGVGVFGTNFLNGVRYGKYYQKENKVIYDRWLNKSTRPHSTMSILYICDEISGVAFGRRYEPITTVTTLGAISLFKGCMYGMTMPIMLPKMIYDTINGDDAVHIYPYYHSTSMTSLYQKMIDS